MRSFVDFSWINLNKTELSLKSVNILQEAYA